MNSADLLTVSTSTNRKKASPKQLQTEAATGAEYMTLVDAVLQEHEAGRKSMKLVDAVLQDTDTREPRHRNL
jgi:hypothetical protein